MHPPFCLMYAVQYRSHMRAYNRVHIHVVYCLYTGGGVRIHGGGALCTRVGFAYAQSHCQVSVCASESHPREHVRTPLWVCVFCSKVKPPKNCT